MIIYFADRQFHVLAQASTDLPKGLKVREDIKIEEIETGVASFSGRIPYTEEQRRLCSEAVFAGGYVLREFEGALEAYTITETEQDTSSKDVYFYSEDAGLELLGAIALKLPDGDETTAARTLTDWINLFLGGTGFVIGNNEASEDSTTKVAKWDNETTVAERVRTVASDFGYEISYSYALDQDGFSVVKKYINLHKKRGVDNGVQLRLNQEVDKIVTKTSVNNLVTSLLAYGADNGNGPITLSGYSYSSPDNDFIVGNQYFYERGQTHACLQSPGALAKWGRIINASGTETLRHITKPFHFDTESQAVLAAEAAKELKQYCEPEVNYEIEIARFPENVKIGDYINIIDGQGELYLQARVLKLETSASDNRHTATLGDYLIKTGGISQTVRELASQFQEISANRAFYTWIAYADDASGSGISLSPEGKAFLGIASNRTVKDPIITDPTVYTWSEIQGVDGQAITMSVSSSGGTQFKNTRITSQLIAHVYLSGTELSASEIEELGILNWYDATDTLIGTGQTLSVSTSEESVTYRVKLEMEVT